jgi:hypothetical protein
VKELVRLHLAASRWESVAGMGSTFTVTIPMGKAHLDEGSDSGGRCARVYRRWPAASWREALRWLPDHVGPTHSGETPGPPANKPRILWADDNADMRAYVSRLLGERYDVQAVGMERRPWKPRALIRLPSSFRT